MARSNLRAPMVCHCEAPQGAVAISLFRFPTVLSLRACVSRRGNLAFGFPTVLSLRGPARGRGNLCFWGSSFSFILSLGTRDCHVGTKTVPPRNDRRNGGHHVPEIAASPKIRAPRNDVVGWYRFLAMTLCGDVGSLQ